MYIESSYFVTFPEKIPVIPRNRYKEYYKDLHARYKIPLDDSTLLDGSQYKFNELAYPIFDNLIEDKMINKIDTMVLTHWAHEFDQDYATLGPHLSFRYNFNWNMFDVLDQGSMCAVTALSVIKKLRAQKILCLAMDQTTIPRSNAKNYVIPTITASAAFCLSKQKPKNNAIKIISSEIWLENKLCEKKLDVVDLILESLSEYKIDINNCILSCKKNSAVYRAVNFHKHKYKEFSEKIELSFRSIHSGCTEIFYCVDQLNKNIKNLSKQYFLYLDEDSDSLIAGLVILELPIFDGVEDYAA